MTEYKRWSIRKILKKETEEEVVQRSAVRWIFDLHKQRQIIDVTLFGKLAGFLFSKTQKGKQQYILATRAQDCFYKPYMLQLCVHNDTKMDKETQNKTKDT